MITKREDVHKPYSLLGFMLLAFAAGLVALLTPCVFPMIPMTVTFFTTDSGGRRKSAVKIAIFYGLSIIFIYTFLGIIVAMLFGPAAANFLSTHWLPNVLFFLVFVIFGLSFLGMFEITLPNWLINKADAQSDKGGLYGAFFLAFTLVLVSFSCTGPIVGAILVESAGGQLLKPTLGMFSFSLAFAIPFSLFAIFPSWLRSLPKSGGWLNSVKVVLGFLELALALKFLSIADQVYHWGILDREVYLAFGIVIFTLMGFYILGKVRLPNDSEVKVISVTRLVLSLITFTFVIYLVPGMFGAPLKALSGYLPPLTSHDLDLPEIIRQNATANLDDADKGNICDKPIHSDDLHLPHGLKGYFDFQQGLACAKKLEKPVFLDFTGHACVNCREMESNVWAKPEVLKRLKNDYVIIALYVDDKKELDESQWYTSDKIHFATKYNLPKAIESPNYDDKVKKTIGKQNANLQIIMFNNNAQPYYLLLDHNGEKLAEPKTYDKDWKNFVKFLDEGLKVFENNDRLSSL
ncbi:MAG: thioredoxin family protein [Bacteroidetes bacterium]|nr:thioredoxin family protein [Bacteroidota bacterium]